MNKDLKKFIFFLIASIIVAFAVSYSYSAYQSYQQEKKIDAVKKAFGFGGKDKITSEVEKNSDPQEAWQNRWDIQKLISDLFIKEYMIN